MNYIYHTSDNSLLGIHITKLTIELKAIII